MTEAEVERLELERLIRALVTDEWKIYCDAATAPIHLIGDSSYAIRVHNNDMENDKYKYRIRFWKVITVERKQPEKPSDRAGISHSATALSPIAL